MDIHILVSHTTLLFKTACTIHLYSTEVHKMLVAVILQWIHTLAL